MKLSNYHTHCYLDDGKSSMLQMIEQAQKIGFSALGFSLHAPYAPLSGEDWPMDISNLGFYHRYLKDLKKKYNSNNFEILCGLEIDNLSIAKNSQLPIQSSDGETLSFDYLLGSVHGFKIPHHDKEEIFCVDGPDFHIQKLITYFGSLRKLCEEFYRTTATMARNGGYQIVGHLDKIKKNQLDNPLFKGSEKWYCDLVEETLEEIATGGEIIEVNTGLVMRAGKEVICPEPWIIKRCYEKKIPMTINNDAHHITHLGVYHQESAAILRDAGYREITHIHSDNSRTVSLI